MTPSGLASSGWSTRTTPRSDAAGVRLECRWRLGSGGTLVLRLDGRGGELILDHGRARPAHPIVGANASARRTASARWRVDVEPDASAGLDGFELRLVPASAAQALAAVLHLVERPNGGSPLVLTTIPEAIGLLGGTYALDSIATAREGSFGSI